MLVAFAELYCVRVRLVSVNSAMTLAILNGGHRSSQSSHSVDTNAWCKRAIHLKIAFAEPNHRCERT